MRSGLRHKSNSGKTTIRNQQAFRLLRHGNAMTILKIFLSFREEMQTPRDVELRTEEEINPSLMLSHIPVRDAQCRYEVHFRYGA